MQGTIINFRRGIKTTYKRQMVVSVKDISDKKKAEALVGKKAVWNSGKKDIAGVVNAVHGGKGALRVVFEKGMPGQAIGTKVKIE